LATYDDVYNQINKASNTLSTPNYQSYDWTQNAANSIYNTMQPTIQQQKAGVNQSYNTSQRSIAEKLAAQGLLRGGQYGNQLTANEQNRNTALGGVESNAWNTALSQANTAANTALSERGLLQGQQYNAANQLASLLGQQQTNQIQRDTLSEQIAARQVANQLAAGQLTGTYNGAQTADVANQNYQNALALLQALQNYNLGVGQVTDTLPQISGYNYGDVLKDLLTRLGAA